MKDYHDAINWSDENLLDRLTELTELSQIPHGEARTRELGKEAICLAFEYSMRTGAQLLGKTALEAA